MKMLMCSAATVLLCTLAATSTDAVHVSSKAGPPVVPVSPVVMTPYGAVSGAMDRGTTYSFKGIPYAAPPTGNLRFANPEEPATWTGTRDASEFGAGCMAICPPSGFPKPKIVCTPTVSEDCLFLNVYTPTLNATANLPVMMFIHGGNYMYGSGGVAMFDGSSFAQNQSSVVVTINYRLGAFGGLHTSMVEGNFQTKDQRQAMKWIKKSIANFGGNPNRVILSGQSAGATSMAVHMASPPSWPYFHGVIIESYPASLISPTPEMATTLGKEYVKKIGCPTTGGQAELDCLRNTSAAILLNASDHTQYFPWPNMILAEMMRWQPIVGTTDLPMQPITAMRQGNVSNAPVFIGTNANETAEFVYRLFDTPVTQEKMDITILGMFGIEDGSKITKFYGNAPESMKADVRPFFTVLATDYLFYCPTRYYASAATNHTASYVYYFDKAPYWNAWFYAEEPYCVQNVCHASDIPFWSWPWGSNSLNAVHSQIPQPHPDDLALSGFVQTAWGNFVKSGNPNTPNALPNANGHSYPVFNGHANVLVNSSTPVGQITGYRQNVCDFWDTIGYMRN